MQHVDDASDTLTAEVWQEVIPPRAAARPESRLGRLLNSLAASMALQQRKPWSPGRDDRIVYPSEILAQNYPRLYIQVMCA